MVKVFGQTDTDFTSNGDIVLQPLKAKVHKEDNGDYYLDLECGLEYLDYITQGRIVVANTPTGDQAFRIGNVTKTGKKISTRCWHVCYDSKLYFCFGFGAQNTIAGYLATAINQTEPQPPFTTSSDIQGTQTFTDIPNWTSLYDILQSIVSQSGGHVVRDDFSIAVNSSIGDDNGVVIRYGSNLREISCVENWDDVCTYILPIGKDETLLNAVDVSADVLMYSDTQYDLPYFKRVTFDQSYINRDNYSSQAAYTQALVADLTTQARNYLNAHALPEVSYTMKAHIDKISDVGDTIEVIDERLGLDLMVNISSFDYDCISERFTEVVFGNYRYAAKGMGFSVNKVATNQRDGITAGKRLIFNPDNTLSWVDVT